MKPQSLIGVATLVACFALPLAANAQTAPAAKAQPAAAAKAPAAPAARDGAELGRATCADIFGEMAAADPQRNKGSAEDIAAAQDNVYSVIMWVNGYLSGRDGVDFAKRPLNQAGIAALVNQVVAVCKPDTKQLFLTAIRNIK